MQEMEQQLNQKLILSICMIELYQPWGFIIPKKIEAKSIINMNSYCICINIHIFYFERGFGPQYYRVKRRWKRKIKVSNVESHEADYI